VLSVTSAKVIQESTETSTVSRKTEVLDFWP